MVRLCTLYVALAAGGRGVRKVGRVLAEQANYGLVRALSTLLGRQCRTVRHC